MAFPRRPSVRVSTTAAVTTGSQLLVADNPSRLELTITNNHATTDVHLDLRVAAGVSTVDPVAVVGEGILLKAAGGSWTTTSYTGPVAVIGGAAGTIGVVDI